MTRLRQRMLEDLRRRNYSPDTICGYIRAASSLLSVSAGRQNNSVPNTLVVIRSTCRNDKKLAPGSVGNCVSALRFLYKRTLKRRDLAFDDLAFPQAAAQPSHGA